MANYNLTNQAIEDSFQPLLQIDSGSALRDGSGSIVDNIIVTSSYALTASFAENVIPIDTGSLLTTASFDNGTRDLTFTKGDSSIFAVNIPGGSIDTGSLATTGSNNFIGNQNISGSVESTINFSNTHLNPQTITDNVTIPTGLNGVIIGETTIVGDYTIEGNSEVYVFTPPVLLDTGSFATTGSNTFNGSQIINGDDILLNKVGSFDPKITVSGSNTLRSQLFPEGLKVDGIASYFKTMNIVNLGSNTNHALFFGKSNSVENLNGLPQNRVGFFYGDTTAPNPGDPPGTPPYHQFYLDINNENFFIEGSNLTVSQSLNVKEIINLEPQATLPTGSLGDLATSGSELYFNDGANWRTVNLT